MSKVEFVNEINKFALYYSKELVRPEYETLFEIFKDYSVEFLQDVRDTYVKKNEFFKIASIVKIVEDFKELDKLKRQLGIKSFDELYEN